MSLLISPFTVDQPDNLFTQLMKHNKADAANKYIEILGAERGGGGDGGGGSAAADGFAGVRQIQGLQ